ncbi:MAG: hypothetical protein JW384_00081 [Nitrosomonadaceae bacterium]|nr:hypothetical protein [Nitrosomonadaceae bacterium]
MQLSNTSPMTLPDERYRAVIETRRFLEDLCDPQKTPRLSRTVRATASSLLRHYPGDWAMNQAAQTSPGIFQERMEDLHRFVAVGSRQAADPSDIVELMQGYRET